MDQLAATPSDVASFGVVRSNRLALQSAGGTLSDVSQGPGWWQASDAKWYPPQLHPSARQQTAPPPTDDSLSQEPIARYGYQGPQTQPLTMPPVRGNYPPGYGPPPGSALAPGYGYQAAPWVQQAPSAQLDAVVQLPLAPWWKRMVAVLADAMILSFFYLAVFAVIGAASSTSGSQSNTNNTQTGVAGIVIGLIIGYVILSLPAALYCGIMNGSRKGQTFGKMALGITVRDSRSGQPIGFWRGVGRFLITTVFIVFLIIPFVLDCLAPLWDGRNQAWHDKVVHSVVTEVTS
jgi:uncharacterized RDD family membrane protein YckC